MRAWIAAIVVSLSSVAAPAVAADAATLSRLTVPPAAPLQPLPTIQKPRAVKFARMVVQLKPEPWALVSVDGYLINGRVVGAKERLVSWEEGQSETDPSFVASIFAEEMKRAGVPTDSSAESLFAQESAAELQIGVRVTELNGRFCGNCRMLPARDNWMGAVTMTATWEVYSPLDRKVVSTIQTRGGYETPKEGLNGEPTRLIYEAFRDGVRRLVASEDFRRAVTAPREGSGPGQPSLTPIAFRSAAPARRPIASAADAVAAVFAGDGHGTGFLISADGYLLTNQHVVGGSKFVKVRWPDKSEVLGEVVRVDRRRDIALVKVEAGARKPLAVRRAAPDLGEAVFAIGTPLDPKLQGTVTKGIVSASRAFDGQPFIQSDVVVNGGNSGGPLLDESGAVIGVTVSGYEISGAPVGINLFIPIEDALKVLALQPAS